MNSKAQRKITSRSIFSLFENQSHTDVELVLWKETISAHKIVLISGSDYFARNLLSNQMKIDEPGDLFRQVLRALYGQKLTLPWTHQLIWVFIKYEVKAFDLAVALRSVEVQSETFSDYLLYLNRLNSSGIPPKVLLACSILLKPEYEYDALSKLPDNLIVEFLSSPYYSPQNIHQLLLLVKRLVEAGHDRSLYDLIDYRVMPEKFRKEIPSGVKNGHVPGLSCYRPHRGKYGEVSQESFIIMEEPVLVERAWELHRTRIYRTRVCGKYDELLPAVIWGEAKLQVGDIFRGNVEWTFPEFAGQAYFESESYLQLY